MKGLSFSIDSHLGNVSLVAVAVNRICVQLGLDDLSAGQVELCVAEAATNAIRHAYHGEPGHTVVIALAAGTDQLNIEVSDSGTPMPVEQEQDCCMAPRQLNSRLRTEAPSRKEAEVCRLFTILWMKCRTFVWATSTA